MLQENSAKSGIPSDISRQEISTPRSETFEPTGTFSRAIMVESHGYAGRRATHSAVSLGIHITMIAVLLILPLFSSTALRLSAMTQEFVTVPLAPSKESRSLPYRQFPVPAKRLFSSMRLAPPIPPPPRIIPNPNYPLSPMDALQSVSPGSAEGGGNVLGGVINDSIAKLVVPVPPSDAHVIRLGGEVKNTRLVYSLDLAYPALAKAAHIAGRVVLHAVIDKTGKVSNIRAIKGPYLLSSAAIAAISKERFEPMLLNGEPVQCDLIVQVTFALSDSLPD
jgi:protein TonB